ncbi:hypothetical protein SpCBS45565_g08319 [Spizellomyces sp. 'palustris']|nr:hypothetical protein SpCBS45565_g08319 [Spizellomyces sp. 'palustris']
MFGGKTPVHLHVPDTHAVGGRPLVGAVTIDVSSPLEIKGVQVSFYGEAEIEYEYTKMEENSEGQKVSKKHEFKKEKKFDKMKVQVTGPQKLNPGNYTFPFELNLPAHLQPSFKYKKDKMEVEIKYRVHAKVLKGALKSDSKSEKAPVKILPAVPSPSPKEKSDTNKFMFGKGTSTVSVKLPDTTFTLGQAIVFNVECNNDSKKNNKAIKGKLEQKIKLKSGESEVPDYHHEKTVAESKAEGTGENRTSVVRELKLETSNLPPTVHHPFIEIEYKLNASADYSFAKDPAVKVEVVIIPRQAQQSNPGAMTGGNYTLNTVQPPAQPMLMPMAMPVGMPTPMPMPMAEQPVHVSA